MKCLGTSLTELPVTLFSCLSACQRPDRRDILEESEGDIVQWGADWHEYGKTISAWASWLSMWCSRLSWRKLRKAFAWYSDGFRDGLLLIHVKPRPTCGLLSCRFDAAARLFISRLLLMTLHSPHRPERAGLCHLITWNTGCCLFL